MYMALMRAVMLECGVTEEKLPTVSSLCFAAHFERAPPCDLPSVSAHRRWNDDFAECDKQLLRERNAKGTRPIHFSVDAGFRHGVDTNVVTISVYDDELGTVRDELGSMTCLGSKKSMNSAACDVAIIKDLGIDVHKKRFPPAVTTDGAPAALKEHTCIMFLLGLLVIMRFLCDCHALSLGSCKSSKKAFGD